MSGRYNFVAHDLRTPKYKSRIVKSKKAYTRKRPIRQPDSE